MSAQAMPDLFDLQDWCVLSHPDIWAAIKYLHGDVLFGALLAIWESDGQPAIE